MHAAQTGQFYSEFDVMSVWWVEFLYKPFVFYYCFYQLFANIIVAFLQ